MSTLEKLPLLQGFFMLLADQLKPLNDFIAFWLLWYSFLFRSQKATLLINFTTIIE